MRLLVYLAIERQTTRDAAAAVLWPEQEQSRARHALPQTLYELRRDLGDDWLVSEGELLGVTPTLEVDAVDFEAAVEAGHHEKALQLYQGAFLEGYHLAGTSTFQNWTDQVRDHLSRLHRRTRRERVFPTGYLIFKESAAGSSSRPDQLLVPLNGRAAGGDLLRWETGRCDTRLLGTPRD